MALVAQEDLVDQVDLVGIMDQKFLLDLEIQDVSNICLFKKTCNMYES